MEDIPPFTMDPDPLKKEWIVKNSEGNVVAILDFESGNLKILGKLLPFKEYSLSGNPDTFLNKSKFVVRASTTDDSIVFVIDKDGNLYVKGAIMERFLFL